MYNSTINNNITVVTLGYLNK